jgi:3',5'-cyclic AMP phosphodiesterase CpdA
MRLLAHISDLHFGADLPPVAQGLLSRLMEIQPDLVVVSGDLTQRATSQQFQHARLYMDSIPFPKLIVPGNHDVSFYSPYRRFLLPLSRYRKYITQDLSPYWLDEEIAVLGINTARSLTLKNGRISIVQMDLIQERFCSVPKETFKVLVTHHPFIAPPGRERESVVGRAAQMFMRVQQCSPDMALAGHFHTSYNGATHSVYTAQKGSTLVVQAGTAISRRTRDEQNAFNIMRIDKGEVELFVEQWNGEIFTEHRRHRFLRENEVWLSKPDAT